MVRRICESGDHGRRVNRNHELANILLSVAVADAIGADVEFMPNPTKRDFLAQVNGVHPLRVTDDPQMSLFTAEALLKGYKSRDFQRAYLQWYQTQMANPPVVSKYSLMGEAVLYSQSTG